MYKKALIRALHTFWQTLAATAPVGIKITADQITNADWRKILLSVLAWLGTAVLAGVFSFVKSMAVGMPEAEGKITFPAYEEFDENGDPVR